MLSSNPPHKMTTFTIVWLGQLISLLGSSLTGFALGVWAFQRTGSATQFALIGLCAVLPRLLLSPLAGALVDRWDRRRAMIVSDTGAGLSTLVLVFLLSAHRLEIWHIYVLTAASASFGALQWPAYAAAMTLLVPKAHLGRANGMVQLGRAAAEILAPALAGVLLRTIQMRGVILVDVATFVFAVATLLPVRFPKPTVSTVIPRQDSLRHQLTFGWAYISARPGLLTLLVFFAVVNFLWGMVAALVTPMILSWTTSETLGVLLSIAGAGMLAGSLLMSAWGGPKRRINGVLTFELLSGLCFVAMGLRPSFWPLAAGAFVAHMTIAIVQASNQAIWQSKVAPDVQGRVFGTQQTVAGAMSPLAFVLAGPLADGGFNPLLAVDGPLADSVGKITGTGAGRGIGLLFVVMGITKAAIALAGQSLPHIRHIEDELPDALPGPATPVPGPPAHAS